MPSTPPKINTAPLLPQHDHPRHPPSPPTAGTSSAFPSTHNTATPTALIAHMLSFPPHLEHHLDPHTPPPPHPLPPPLTSFLSPAPRTPHRPQHTHRLDTPCLPLLQEMENSVLLLPQHDHSRQLPSPRSPPPSPTASTSSRSDVVTMFFATVCIPKKRASTQLWVPSTSLLPFIPRLNSLAFQPQRAYRTGSPPCRSPTPPPRVPSSATCPWRI